MTNDESYPGPFTLDPIKGNHRLWKQRDLATAVARPGDDVRDVSARLRGYTSKGYLHPIKRDANDARGSLLFDDAAALTAAAFQTIAASGLSNAAAMRAVEIALQSFKEEHAEALEGQRDVRNPADLMLKAWREEGVREWTLRLQFRRCAVSGEQEVRAGLMVGGRDFGPPLMPRDGYGIESELIVPLDDLISRVAANTTRLREAH